MVASCLEISIVLNAVLMESRDCCTDIVYLSLSLPGLHWFLMLLFACALGCLPVGWFRVLPLGSVLSSHFDLISPVIVLG